MRYKVEEALACIIDVRVVTFSVRQKPLRYYRPVTVREINIILSRDDLSLARDYQER